MYSPGEEIVQIVDEENRKLGELPRRLMREQGLIHQAGYILVFNAAANFLSRNAPRARISIPAIGM